MADVLTISGVANSSTDFTYRSYGVIGYKATWGNKIWYDDLAIWVKKDMSDIILNTFTNTNLHLGVFHAIYLACTKSASIQMSGSENKAGLGRVPEYGLILGLVRRILLNSAKISLVARFTTTVSGDVVSLSDTSVVDDIVCPMLYLFRKQEIDYNLTLSNKTTRMQLTSEYPCSLHPGLMYNKTIIESYPIEPEAECSSEPEITDPQARWPMFAKFCKNAGPYPVTESGVIVRYQFDAYCINGYESKPWDHSDWLTFVQNQLLSRIHLTVPYNHITAVYSQYIKPISQGGAGRLPDYLGLEYWCNKLLTDPNYTIYNIDDKFQAENYGVAKAADLAVKNNPATPYQDYLPRSTPSCCQDFVFYV
jgi:hypothetical protein